MFRRRAFSLIELVIVVIILGIIGAIAIPRMSRGASAAREGSLVTDLARLRAAIQLYHAEHDENYPSGSDIATQLTSKTDIDGLSDGDTNGLPDIYGPYLREIPTLKAGSKAGEGLNKIGTSTDATNAWLYTPADGTIQADLPDADVDDNGVKLNSY